MQRCFRSFSTTATAVACCAGLCTGPIPPGRAQRRLWGLAVQDSPLMFLKGGWTAAATCAYSNKLLEAESAAEITRAPLPPCRPQVTVPAGSSWTHRPRCWARFLCWEGQGPGAPCALPGHNPHLNSALLCHWLLLQVTRQPQRHLCFFQRCSDCVAKHMIT